MKAKVAFELKNPAQNSLCLDKSKSGRAFKLKKVEKRLNKPKKSTLILP